MCRVPPSDSKTFPFRRFPCDSGPWSNPENPAVHSGDVVVLRNAAHGSSLASGESDFVDRRLVLCERFRGLKEMVSFDLSPNVPCSIKERDVNVRNKFGNQSLKFGMHAGDEQNLFVNEGNASPQKDTIS